MISDSCDEHSEQDTEDDTGTTDSNDAESGDSASEESDFIATESCDAQSTSNVDDFDDQSIKSQSGEELSKQGINEDSMPSSRSDKQPAVGLTIVEKKISMVDSCTDEQKRQNLIKKYHSFHFAAQEGNLDAVQAFVEIGEEVKMIITIINYIIIN